MDIVNLSIVRQTFANTVFTHKVHEVAAEFYESKSKLIKRINVFVVLIILIILLLQAYYPANIIFSYIGAGVTIFEIFFLIFQLSFPYDQNMVLHKNSALKFMDIRDRYRNLIADIMNSSLTKQEVINKRDHLQSAYQTICDFSPQTGRKEYVETQKRLNKRRAVEGEDFTWSDEEIDRFLSKKLRLKKNIPNS